MQHAGVVHDEALPRLEPEGDRHRRVVVRGEDGQGQVGRIDSAGNALVGGETKSPGWVSGGYDTTHNGHRDAFVAKIYADCDFNGNGYHDI